MALGDLMKTMKKPHSLLGEVDRYLLKLQGKSTLEDDHEREQGVWHPSEVSTTECIRELVYKWLKTPKSDQDVIRPQIRRLFDVGHNNGYQFQGYFWDMGVLLGKWHCIECKHRWMDLDNPSPRKCPNCGTKFTIWYNLKYEEVPIRIDRGDKPPVAGHADGMILDPKADSKKRIAELKTIKSAEDGWTEQQKAQRDFFQKINEPLEKHNFQLNLYMFATGVPDGFFFYSNKNDQTVKEYMVRMYEPYVKKQFFKMEQTERALDEGYLPDRISDDKACSDCRFCSYKTLCHGAEHSFADVDHRKQKEAVTSGNS